MIEDRVVRREMDIAYVLGERKVLEYDEISADHLTLMREVWDRAFQMGIWHGLDLTTARVQESLSVAAEDAARTD